ncbi:MAG: response regulator [Chloroflexi bacterium]|nr:response regulator [Chloroflexota bacterium]
MSPSLTGIRALIIEDEQTSIDVLRNLLSQLDVDTSVIYGGPEVDQHIRDTSRPDVIFLDLEMPGFNGYEVLEMIKADAEFEGVPVVAYTTHISHMNDARRAGFNSFLGKPLHRYEFADNLIRILNGESVWEAP